MPYRKRTYNKKAKKSIRKKSNRRKRVSKRKYVKRGGYQTTQVSSNNNSQCNGAVNNADVFQSTFSDLSSNNSNSNSANNYYHITPDILVKM